MKKIPVQFLLGKPEFERNNRTSTDFAHPPKVTFKKSL